MCSKTILQEALREMPKLCRNKRKVHFGFVLFLMEMIQNPKEIRPHWTKAQCSLVWCLCLAVASARKGKTCFFQSDPALICRPVLEAVGDVKYLLSKERIL